MPKRNPFQRLRHARVVQVLIVYLGASWLVLQIAETLTEILALPAWVPPVAIILLLIGMVIILATAWVQSHPTTTRREEAGEVPTDWEIDARGVLQSLRAGTIPHLTWGRVILGGVVALSFLFGVAGLYVLVGSDRPVVRPIAAGAGEPATAIAVLPFSTTGPDLELWREGMVDLLSTGLDGVGGLRTIDSRTVHARWREAVGPRRDELPLDEALRVAGRTGAQYALMGNAVALGPEVRMAADLYDLSDGSTVAQATAQGPADSVLVLADELGLGVLREMLAGTGSRIVAGQRLSAITTSSLDAMRAYVQGEAAFRAGDFETATRRYLQAVAADSSFALAHYRLGDVHGWTVGISSPQTRRYAARALRLAHRLPDRHRALLEIDAAIGTQSLWSAEKAETLVRQYPDDPEAWTVLAEANLHRSGAARGGARRAREALDRALALEPDFLSRYYHALQLAIAFADTARAAELLERARSIERDDPVLTGHAMQFRAYLGQGEPEAYADSIVALGSIALRRFGHVATMPAILPRFVEITLALPTSLVGSAARSDRLAAVGRMNEALEAAERAVAADPTLAGFRNAQVAAWHYLGARPVSEQGLDALACPAAPAGPATSCWMALLMAGRGFEGGPTAGAAFRAEARALQAKLDSVGPYEVNPWAPDIFRSRAQRLEGMLAWREGDLDRAYAQLDSALRRPGDSDREKNYTAFALADLQEERADLAGAVAALRSQDLGYLVPFSHLRIAELQERLGNREGARRYYRSALAAWDGADPGFPPKARAEEGMARLDGG